MCTRPFSAAFVPDDASRAGAVPAVQAAVKVFATVIEERGLQSSVCEESRNTLAVSCLQTIREDFGTLRVDLIIFRRAIHSLLFIQIDDGEMIH